MKPVDVGMYNVEILCLLRNCFKQKSRGGHRVSTLLTEAQPARPHRVKATPCSQIATRKQRDRVSQLDQFINQPGDHSLRAAVELGRHTLG